MCLKSSTASEESEDMILKAVSLTSGGDVFLGYRTLIIVTPVRNGSCMHRFESVSVVVEKGRTDIIAPSDMAELQYFLDGVEPPHTHRACGYCSTFGRCHGKLLKCAGCGDTKYCSKECQRADWPQHKSACRMVKLDNERLAQISGLSKPLSELYAWEEYYDTVLKNCAIASYGFRKYPPEARVQDHHMFTVCLTYKRDRTLPIHDRFTVEKVYLEDRHANELMELIFRSVEASLPQRQEMGRIEMGNNYYTTVTYVVFANFGAPGASDPGTAYRLKQFSIDKRAANANVVREDWWMLLREYVNAGRKIKFCCGKIKIPGAEDLCCCGGWVHEGDKASAFRKANNK
ncbi:hypothetical protein VKT23_008561 [Stygiomarasmius scandens]|uniref:MYND-type domain-containing protein n=1 Tax=Marasmiellus scandens TaxID=2682957 RepID=A0ABR1JK22_9AGAR